MNNDCTAQDDSQMATVNEKPKKHLEYISFLLQKDHKKYYSNNVK